jgi:hypothetical protein
MNTRVFQAAVVLLVLARLVTLASYWHSTIGLDRGARQLDAWEARMQPAWLAALPALQFLGYFAVYVLTPHDLVWHMGTALTRLILHLSPAILFLFFCALPAPERTIASRAEA